MKRISSGDDAAVFHIVPLAERQSMVFTLVGHGIDDYLFSRVIRYDSMSTIRPPFQQELIDSNPRDPFLSGHWCIEPKYCSKHCSLHCF